MPEVIHDPKRFAAELGAKLAARSRHVCAFFGAGVSRACGLPDVSGLEKEVAEKLDGEDKARFEQLLEGRNLEEVLTRLRRIAALLDGGGRVDELSSKDAEKLDRRICTAITKQLDLSRADLDPMRLFAAWAARADYHAPLELFSVNYDLLLETALEELRALWFDGFVGTLKARFNVELVEGMSVDERDVVPRGFVRVWKLHGSLNWAWRGDPAEIVRLGIPVPEGQAAAIYPAETKYQESRRVPFVTLMDRLRRALQEPESLTLVTGYSFGDAHLNELIFDAAARRPRSEFIVFCHSSIPLELVQRSTRTPALSVVTKDEAILGGQRGNWSSDDDTPGVWEGGHLLLGDFKNLAAFLARSQVHEGERDDRA
jgi:SIR2-like domain